MRKILAVVVAVAFVGATAGPALADCATDIAKVEPQIMKITDAAKKTKAEKELTEAKDSAKKKNEKECLEYLSSAKKTAGIK